MRRRFFFAGLVIFSFAPFIADAQSPPKTTVVDQGTETAEGGVKIRTTLTLAAEVAPGSNIANEFTQFGEVGRGGLASSVDYYFAGIDGRTLHILKISRELRGGRGEFAETERLPILLPLGSDDQTSFQLWSSHSKKNFIVRLKRNADNSITTILLK